MKRLSGRFASDATLLRPTVRDAAFIILETGAGIIAETKTTFDVGIADCRFVRHLGLNDGATD